MSRVKNSLKNISYDLGGHAVKLVVQFFCRRVFVQVLAEEYLGINGLFSNILMLLSLAELGIGSAITFSLYEPLANRDVEKIHSLMALFKKAYTIIGVSVAVIGTALTPFLDFFVAETPDIQGLPLIYLLYVFNSAASYFYTYKRTLIIADQKSYIVSKYSYGVAVAMNIAQIFGLLIFRNFYVYLCSMIIFTLTENILISRKADRLYPYIRKKNALALDPAELMGIKKNVAALISHQIGRVVINGTDNLLIARIVDLVSVGLYSNYLMIKGALSTLLGGFYSGVYASIGNVNATETARTKQQVFEHLIFFSHWMYSFCTICLFCLFNPFIELWLGEHFLFPPSIVLVICLDFFVYGYRYPVSITKNAAGLYWNDRYKPIAEAVINIVSSILLGRHFGIAGVLMGTVLSSMLTNFWIEPRILYKNTFHASVKSYFGRYFLSCIITAVAGSLTWYLCSLLPTSGLLSFVFKMMICAVTPNLVWLLLQHKNEHFHYYRQLVKNLLKKRSR